MKQGFYNMSAEAYHNDPCEVPSLTQSIAHVLDSQSPLHAFTRHPKLGGVPRPHTKAFDMGSLSHALLLGQGKDVAVINCDDYRTKEAQAARDEARRTGRISVLSAHYEQALSISEALRHRFSERGIDLDGKSEVVALWSESTLEGEAVQCRGMMDHVKEPVIYDLKSCRSASLDACRRHIDSYGYAIQRAAYVSAMEQIRPEFAGRADFVFIFYELEPPFAVTPVKLSGAFRQLGERRWKRAVETWARCLRENHWPEYVDQITEIEPMPWALSNDMERQIKAASSTWLEELPI